MNVFIKIFIFGALFLSLNNTLVAKIENKIILKVENKIITNYEIKNKILSSLILSNQEINQYNINKIKKQSLDSLILHKLKIIELSKYNFENDTKQINNYLNTISSNNVEGLKNRFRINGIDFKLFLNEIETQFKWQKLIYQIYSNKININEKIINFELQELINNKSELKEYRLSEIEIFSDNNDSDKDKILYVKEQIAEQGFDKTALNLSISSTAKKFGDLGWLNEKSFSNEIYKIIKNMRVGDISEPLKRQNSIIFLKLNDFKKSNTDKLDVTQIKKDLINKKKSELFNLYSKSHLSKLKNTSLIEYR